jgi:hypothetical protein
MKKLLLLLCIIFSCVTVLYSQDIVNINNKVRDAVNNLASKLVRRWEVSIGDITLDGTDLPSDLSRYLCRTIRTYAVQNPMFLVNAPSRVLKKQDEPEKAIITGTFSQMGNNVQVNLYLVSDINGINIASNIFYIPVDQLQLNGISIKPENTPAKITVSQTSSTQNIKIQAWFYTESRTFQHCDELKLTVSTDKDCYFKIIHIDVGNQIRMIYPRNKNDDNSLRANVSRNVFGTQDNRYIFYGPYGAETLVLVASPVQFSDIDKEYGQPWKVATEDAINKAIAGAGQARYPITILKPHEEYEYKKPENMTDIYQAIRDDMKAKNGHFEGSEKFGIYIIDNIRGSYLIPPDKPDIIQFASYPDAYTGVTNFGKRGQAYIFSFAKPQNISYAVQMVQTGIKSKGGTFSGDERQGNFNAIGIAGYYKVADKVEVTISEKPFVVPNSMIENEVKNFFGVK